MNIPWSAHYSSNAPETLDFTEKFLQEFLDDCANNFGKNNAIQFHNFKMNYAQLKKTAENFASSLKKLGVEKGDRIAIMLPNIPQTIIAFWGSLKAGATIVMTNPLYMESELTHHFNDSNPKVLITLELFWDKIEKLQDNFKIEKYIVTKVSESLAFPLNFLQRIKAKKTNMAPKINYSHKVLPWKKVIKNKEQYSEPLEGNPSDCIALLQYTGGTTGFSKGAILTHSNLSVQLQQLQEVIHTREYPQDHLFLAVMPFFHVFGLVGCILLPASLKSSVLPVPRYVPSDLLDIIDKSKPTFFVGAPSIYISLMQLKKITKVDMTCIDYCISGAAPFPVASLEKFRAMTKAKITEGLGLTEASPVISANPVYGKQKNGSVGVPIPGTQIKIVDVNDPEKEMAINETGEIIAKGPQVMRGYWNQIEETANTIRNGWLHTGDLAYKDEDGYIFIVDRKKDMAVIAGYNVYPTEIDQVLYTHPKVQEAISLSIPHRSKGEILKAYIVPKNGEEITTAEIISYCKEKLASYKVPRFIEIRNELPKSSVGKILRRILRDEEVQKDKDNEVKTDK